MSLWKNLWNPFLKVCFNFHALLGGLKRKKRGREEDELKLVYFEGLSWDRQLKQKNYWLDSHRESHETTLFSRQNETVPFALTEMMSSLSTMLLPFFFFCFWGTNLAGIPLLIFQFALYEFILPIPFSVSFNWSWMFICFFWEMCCLMFLFSLSRTFYSTCKNTVVTKEFSPRFQVLVANHALLNVIISDSQTLNHWMETAHL